MKRYYQLALTLLAVFFFVGSGVAYASSILNVGLGGTGVGYPSGFTSGQLIYGSGIGNLSSVATSTITFSGPFSGTGFGAMVGGSNTTVTWTGLATSSAGVSGNIPYFTSSSALGNTATGTITCSGTASCGSGSYVLGANLTITGAGGGGAGTVSTSSSETAGQVPYWTTTSGTPAKLTSIATTSLSASSPLSITTGTGYLIGGSNSTIGWSGLSTTSAISTSQLLYATGVSGVASVATSTLTASSPLTGSFSVVGSGGSVGCQTASGSQAGCLSSADWLTFNNKIATSAQETAGQLAMFTTTNGTPAKLSSVATTSVTCSGTASCTGFTVLGASPITISDTGASFGYPFTTATDYNLTTQATSTPLWAKAGIFASSTSQFDQINVGSSTSSTMATSTFYGKLDANGSLYLPSGAANNPTLTFESDNATGLFLSGTSLAVTSSNTQIATFGNAGITLSQGVFIGPTATAAAPTYTFSGSTNTGIFGSSGNLAFSTSGVENARFRLGSWFGIGTTTPQWEVTIATTTAPQLVLEGGTGDAPWALRSIGGALYFATTTNTTFATSTAANTALTIDTNGIPRFPALSSSNSSCLQTNSSGQLVSTGFACSGTGAVSGWATSTPYTGQLLIFPINGTEDVVFGNKGLTSTSTAPFWWDVNATTTYIGNGGTGDSATLFGPTNFNWIAGYHQADNSFAIASGTALGTNNVLTITKGAFVGIGTTTPSWLLTLATSTAPQLVLSDGSKTSNAWDFRSVAGNFYLATSSPSTFATSTGPGTYLTIDTLGRLEIGTSTARGMLNLGTYNSSKASTTITGGKFQFDGMNAAGGPTCTFVNTAGAMVTVANPCNL